MVPEPQRQLTINTTIEKVYHHHHHHYSYNDQSSHVPSHIDSMSDSSNSHNHGGRREGHNLDRPSEHHMPSAEALAAKLETLKANQDRCHTVHHEHHLPHGVNFAPIHIDAGLQKRAQETIQEILERLERRKMESDLLVHNASVPGVEDNGAGRLRHTHTLNPNLLNRDSSHAHTLKQSHGSANLRHS